MVVSRAPVLIARRELFGLLSPDSGAGLVVVAAPPGSGKTVLMRTWIEDAGLADRAAWVTVDRDERDAQRFWLAVVGELRAAIGVDAFVNRLEPTPSFEGEAVVERLISELGSLDQAAVLVIDDLHELRSPEALRQVELLLERRPPLLHVVLASRSDPRIGLHRLRLEGRLVEIRTADLRFPLEETRELLEAADVLLSDESLAQLHERTEGWVAGLRLAALALASHPDPERFVAEFTGSERTVADYLFAEVLERQSAVSRRLLLRTSILDRVNAPLADVLTGTSGSQRILHELEQENAFVMSLDTSRTLFRYHSLFSDLLRLELQRTEPEAVSELHRTAAGWYAAQGKVVDAVRHAQAAGDWAVASRVLADNSFSLWLDGQGETTYALLTGFPSAVVSSDPELARLFAAGATWRGSLTDAATYLSLAEANVSKVPEERRMAFDTLLRLTRLQLARRRGDFGAALAEAQPLLDAETPAVGLSDDQRAAVLIHLGISEVGSGELADAQRHLEQAREWARLGGRPYLEVEALGHLGLIAGRRGAFAEVRALALEAIALAEAHGWDADRVAGPALVALAGVDVWQGRFEDAGYWLDRAEQAVRPELDPRSGLLLHLARGRHEMARGRYEEAAAAFRAVGRLEELVVAPAFVTAPARRHLAQTQVLLGDSPGARATATVAAGEGHGGDANLDGAALAYIHLADGHPDEAVQALRPVLEGRTASLPLLHVEALLLNAAAHDLLGDRSAAESNLERALELAEPEQLIWPFAVSPARTLVERHPAHRSARGPLLKDILAVLAGSAPSPTADVPAPLRQHLSESELRILRYLPSNLSLSDIGRELYLSAHTVKTHVRHIYAKLEVHRRTEAVERARKLGLLAPSPRLS